MSNEPTPMELLKLMVTRPLTALGIIRLGAKGIDPATTSFKQGEMESGLQTFVDAVLGAESYEQMPEERKDKVYDNIKSLKAELLGPGFLPLHTDQFRRIQQPTLLVNGAESIGLFHRLTDRIEELVPHSERIHIPDATHIMHQENAAAFNKGVLSFIEKHGNAH